nr:uncharacterized protein LOC121122800 [Lepeophtheirus salmonis]
MDNTCLCNNKDVTCLNCNCTYYQYDEELCPSSFIDYDDTMPINPTVEQQPEYQDNPKIISADMGHNGYREPLMGHYPQEIGQIQTHSHVYVVLNGVSSRPARQQFVNCFTGLSYYQVTILPNGNQMWMTSYQVTTTGDLKTAILGNREDLDTLSTVSTTAIERDLEHPTFQEIKQWKENPTREVLPPTRNIKVQPSKVRKSVPILS